MVAFHLRNPLVAKRRGSGLFFMTRKDHARVRLKSPRRADGVQFNNALAAIAEHRLLCRYGMTPATAFPGRLPD